MNTTLFSFFLFITLGFSTFSASVNTGNIWDTPDNTQFTITLSENLVLSTGFSQDGNHAILINELVEVRDYDRYQDMITASKHISDTKAIMERVLPNARLRLTDSDDLTGSGNNTNISEFIETITDTFYQGGAKTPSLPVISIAITTAGTEFSLQMLQLMDTFRNGPEPFFDDNAPSWSEPIQYIKNQASFKFSLVNSIEEFLASSKFFLVNSIELTYNIDVCSTVRCVCPAKLYPAACAAAKGLGLPAHDAGGGGRRLSSLEELGRSPPPVGVGLGLGGLVTTKIIFVESSLDGLISNKLDENSSN